MIVFVNIRHQSSYYLKSCYYINYHLFTAFFLPFFEELENQDHNDPFSLSFFFSSPFEPNKENNPEP